MTRMLHQHSESTLQTGNQIPSRGDTLEAFHTVFSASSFRCVCPIRWRLLNVRSRRCAVQWHRARGHQHSEPDQEFKARYNVGPALLGVQGRAPGTNPGTSPFLALDLLAGASLTSTSVWRKRIMAESERSILTPCHPGLRTWTAVLSQDHARPQSRITQVPPLSEHPAICR